MASFGLGFSQQEVNRKCRTVLYKDRYKNSRFRSLGKNIVRGMKVVRSMENVGAETGPGQAGEASRDQAVTLIIGGERETGHRTLGNMETGEFLCTKLSCFPSFIKIRTPAEI